MIDGSSIQIHCAGNPNSLRSAALNFVVLDEFGFMDPEIWPAVVRPTRQHMRDSRPRRKHKQCVYPTYIHHAMESGVWVPHGYSDPETVRPSGC